MKIILRRIEQILKRYFESREQQLLQEQVAFQHDEWLDVLQVMELLHISQRTFYRLAKVSGWTWKKIGGRTYYLKSSIISIR